MEQLTIEKFEEAYNIVRQAAAETKLVYSDYFSEQTGNKVYLKPENMQVTGAYKIRGAYYKISTLTRRGREIRVWLPLPQETMPRAWLMRQRSSACAPLS